MAFTSALFGSKSKNKTDLNLTKILLQSKTTTSITKNSTFTSIISKMLISKIYTQVKKNNNFHMKYEKRFIGNSLRITCRILKKGHSYYYRNVDNRLI